MSRHGIIYQSGKSPSAGTVWLTPKRAGSLFSKLGRLAGSGLIAISLMGLSLTLWPIAKSEISYRLDQIKQVTNETASEVLAEEKNLVRQEAESLGLDAYFSLYIPKIEAKTKIVPNVDAGNSSEYLTALKQGVAHARGTYFPGQGESIYLFAHSTDSPLNFAQYNAVFYLLNQLDPGDRIVVYFLDKKYQYLVEEKVVVPASDVSWFGKRGQELLILQTCDPPGTSLRRLLVIAKPTSP